MIRAFFRFWSLRTQIRASWEEMRRDMLAEVDDDDPARLSSDPPPPMVRSSEVVNHAGP